MRTGRALAALFTLTLVLPTSGAGLSQGVAPAGGSPTVRVMLRAVETPESGPASVANTANTDLRTGETGAITFWVDNSLCEHGTGGGIPHGAVASWTVQSTVISARTDRIAIDVSIERRDVPNAVRSDVRHLVLTEGAPHVLDFIEANDSTRASCGTRNIVLDISASIVDSAESAAAAFALDLWLVHRDANGAQWTRHETRLAMGGESVPFRFRSLRFPVDALVSSSGVFIDEKVSGAIRARLRADGSVDVSLIVSRKIASTNGSVGGDGGGPKLFSVGLKEPVSVSLPSPRGVVTTSSAAGTHQVISVTDVFRGHTTALIVVVKHADQ
jgi:hypothetical protein